MELGFFAADTIGVTLYQLKGTLVAHEVHSLSLGPWRLELPVDVQSDILSGTELGFWVTWGKQLRLYVVVRERENWLFVLDAKVLGTCGEKTGFAGETIKDRVVEIKLAIRGVFYWKYGGSWKRVEYDGVPKVS